MTYKLGSWGSEIFIQHFRRPKVVLGWLPCVVPKQVHPLHMQKEYLFSSSNQLL